MKGKVERFLPRGVFEKAPGSKDNWIRYADTYGKIHREIPNAKNLLVRRN
jgi:hypothetical protein